MPSERKFYKRTYCVDILSEEPIREDLDLETIMYAITQGECSGEVIACDLEEFDGPAMAKLLIEQGSDPGFFNLTDDGEDNEDNE